MLKIVALICKTCDVYVVRMYVGCMFQQAVIYDTTKVNWMHFQSVAKDPTVYFCLLWITKH